MEPFPGRKIPGRRLRMQNGACLACYRMEMSQHRNARKQVNDRGSPIFLLRACGLQTGGCIPWVARRSGGWDGMLSAVPQASPISRIG